MVLIVSETSPRFNLEEIGERDFVRAKYHTWEKSRNGLTIAASENELTIIFLPLIHRATCYFSVKAEEVAAGKWEILFSRDLTNIDKVELTYGNDGDADTETPDNE